ncbi:MAG: hypothetical protein ACKO3P_16250, partial [Planctomycetaceae bacterium]
SGGAVSDFLIHNIDECCWFKDAWPVEAKGSGGRHFRGEYVDQNFDSYSTEFTFADGAKMYLEGRTMEGCHNEFASYAHGTKSRPSSRQRDMLRRDVRPSRTSGSATRSR